MTAVADLTSVFNWNVKQLFVYVSASYATRNNGTNEVVVWDRVVNNTADAALHVENEFNKYPLVDKRQDLRGANVTLSLSWDIMPITGLLRKHSLPFALLQLPDAYCLDRESAAAQGVKGAPPLPECEVRPLPLPPQAGRKARVGAAKPKPEAASWADEI